LSLLLFYGTSQNGNSLDGKRDLFLWRLWESYLYAALP